VKPHDETTSSIRKIGHSKGLKFTILTMFLTRVFTPNFGVIEKTLGMAELPLASFWTVKEIDASKDSDLHYCTTR
jgi:hypothetical protein